MLHRSSLSSAALVGSMLLLAGCGDDRAPEAQAPAGAAAAHAPASAPAPDRTAGLSEVKHVELHGWVSEAPDYTNALTLQQGTESQPANLSIAFTGGDKDKSAVRKTITGTIVPASGVIIIEVTNPNDFVVPLTIAIKTGKSWTFHESERVAIAAHSKAPQRVVFDLSKATFKSAETQWKNTGTIGELDQAKELQIGVYNGKQSGSLVVSDVDIRSRP